MNIAVVLITIMPILIFLILHRSTKKDIPAIIKATIAIPLNTDISCMALTTTIFILPSAVNRHITPNVIMTAKYSTIVVMTRHPPQALIKNSNISDSINVMKIIARDMGQVAFKSAMDSSKKPIPKFIVYAIASLLG